jgi:hypothetical protein
MGVSLNTSGISNPNSRGFVDGFESGALSLGSAIANGFTGLINGIANALGGTKDNSIFDPIAESSRIANEAAVSAGQSRLAESIDAAQFYGATWRSTNVNSGGGGSLFAASNTQWSYLAMDNNTGPLKGCHIDSAGLLVLDRKGLWDIKVKVRGYSKESTHRRMLYTYVVPPGYAPPSGLQASLGAYGTPFYYSDATYNVVERNGIVYNQPTDLDMCQLDHFNVNIPAPGYGLMVVFSGMEVRAGASTTVLTASLMDTSVLAQIGGA